MEENGEFSLQVEDRRALKVVEPDLHEVGSQRKIILLYQIRKQDCEDAGTTQSLAVVL